MTGAELKTKLERVQELGGPITIGRVKSPGEVFISISFRLPTEATDGFYLSPKKEILWDAQWLIIGAILEDAKQRGWDLYVDTYTSAVYVALWKHYPSGTYDSLSEADEPELLTATINAWIAAREAEAVTV